MSSDVLWQDLAEGKFAEEWGGLIEPKLSLLMN